MNRRQGHGPPRLIDARGERRLAQLWVKQLKKLMLVLIESFQNTQRRRSGVKALTGQGGVGCKMVIMLWLIGVSAKTCVWLQILIVFISANLPSKKVYNKRGVGLKEW